MGRAPLSDKQEQRVQLYLDDQLTSLFRNFETRTTSTTTLPNINKYLEAVTPLLQFVLQIPASPPSNSLRTAYLLTLTGHLPDALSAYELHESSINALWRTLRLFDKGWTAVLRGQDWDNSRAIDNEIDGRTSTWTTTSTWTERARVSSIVSEVRNTLAVALGLPSTDDGRKEYNPRGQIIEPRFMPDEAPMTNGEEGGEEVRDMAIEESEGQQTPSLIRDGEEDDTETEASANNDDDDEDEFEEVDVASPTSVDATGASARMDAPHTFDVHFHAVPTAFSSDDAPALHSRGFDPDAEFGADDDVDNEEDINIRAEAHKVFASTLQTLAELGSEQ
ncbi:hypothetical protein OIV83_001359 [Microbotryomycetes sp. JL201]|nr:hypothetical protein OIV83_001359 [Microbotryomycetes sp. JL201]